MISMLFILIWLIIITEQMSELSSFLPPSMNWTNEFARMDNIVFSTSIRAKIAQTAPFPSTMHPLLVQSIQGIGIQSLYTHQAEVYENSINKLNQVIIAGTAGGKSLAYSIPVLNTLLNDPYATSLMLFPTKALAQDQWTALDLLLKPINLTLPEAERIIPAIYDGDTPTSKNGRVSVKHPV